MKNLFIILLLFCTASLSAQKTPAAKGLRVFIKLIK